MIIAQFVAAVIIGYLLGSIPFGLIISRRSAKVDLRQYGSGKTGATNVLRTAGRKAAALVGCLDLLKGTLAVVFAGLVVGKSYLMVGNFPMEILVAQVMGGLAAVVGHIWPVFVKFRGGRGVATFFGGLLALYYPAALFGGAVLVIGLVLTRYASLGSIIGVVGTYIILVPLTILKGLPLEHLAYTLVGTIIITVTHRDNIRRLISGNERKLGEKAKYRASSPPAYTRKQDLQGQQMEGPG